MPPRAASTLVVRTARLWPAFFAWVTTRRAGSRRSARSAPRVPSRMASSTVISSYERPAKAAAISRARAGASRPFVEHRHDHGKLGRKLRFLWRRSHSRNRGRWKGSPSGGDDAERADRPDRQRGPLFAAAVQLLVGHAQHSTLRRPIATSRARRGQRPDAGDRRLLPCRCSRTRRASRSRWASTGCGAASVKLTSQVEPARDLGLRIPSLIGACLVAAACACSVRLWRPWASTMAGAISAAPPRSPPKPPSPPPTRPCAGR